MKKIYNFIAAIAAASVIACSPVCTVNADASAEISNKSYTYVNELSGIEFNSYENFVKFVSENKSRSQISEVDASVSDFLLGAEYIYIPDEYKTSEIKSILVTPTYISVAFNINDIYFSFYHYYSVSSAERQINEAKGYYNKNRYSAGKTSVGDNTVYFYERPIFDDTESYYVWEQDDNCFTLRIGEGADELYAKCCNARPVSLSNNQQDLQGTAIKTAKELMNMESDGVYYLANDIDLSNVKWRSISGFKGTFDGNGYEIKNLTSKTYGLFSSLKSNAVVKNVKLTNVNIMSKYKTVGAVASLINSSADNIQIDNCFVSGVVASCLTKYNKSSSSSTAGTIVGKNSSKSTVISNCYSNAVVCAERQAGGIVGINKGSVISSGFGGTIENSKNVYELVCGEDGEVTDDYTYMYCCGGICGINYGIVENCLSNYTDMACSQYNGGFAGRTLPNSKITDSLNLTKIWLSDDMYCGLIAGYASKKADITNCYTRERNNSMALDAVGKTVGKFSATTIALDELGNEKCLSVLGDEWCIDNEKPVLVSIKDYASLEKTVTIKGGKLAAV